MKACKNCSRLIEEDSCPCGGELSKEWQGYLIILDYSRSEIAKKMKIKTNDKFALKVR